METWNALLLGLATAALAWSAGRLPLLGWIALAPLGVVVLRATPLDAALAAGVAGALASAANVGTKTLRPLVPITVASSAPAWAALHGLAALACARLGPASLVVALPLAAVLAPLPMRALGAPRWVSNPLARTQEPWRTVVHAGARGGDSAVTAWLALASSSVALVLAAPASWAVAGLAASCVAVGLLGGALRRRTVERHVDARPRVRVAAVVVDGAPPPDAAPDGLWPARSAEYADVDGTVQRYASHVARAVSEGARVVVLPEAAVRVNASGRGRWLDAVRGWAREHGVAIVAPYFDVATPRNELVIVGADGAVTRHEKQHPGRGLEPPRGAPMPPGPHVVRTRDGELSLSTVICVDLDYPDLVAPVRAAGGLLAVPSNDWPGGFEELHHRTAVWSAVLSGVTVIRATGHGVSSVIDGAGRVLARRTSGGAPVVLVVDAPL